MSRHLPVVSGRELVRALQRAGSVWLRQKGSPVAAGLIRFGACQVREAGIALSCEYKGIEFNR